MVAILGRRGADAVVEELAQRYAAAAGRADAVDALVRHGADIDVRTVSDEQTPLMWAVAANRLEAMRNAGLRASPAESLEAVRAAALVGVVYGGLVAGVLPQPGVSWDGHLCGLAAGGCVGWAAGRLRHRRAGA